MSTLSKPFDPNVGLPDYIYVKLAEFIAVYIEDGTLAPGAMLPGERDLAAQHGVSVGTARKATRLLRERGLVVTVPGKGTYVAVRTGQALGPRNTAEWELTLAEHSGPAARTPRDPAGPDRAEGWGEPQ